MKEHFIQRADKVIIVFLSITLCFGSLFLFWKRHNSGVEDIRVLRGALKSEYLIEDLDKGLFEQGLVNINNAEKAEIMKIPGIGPALAERIIIFRKRNGGFTGKQDLLKISGIGDKKFDIIKKHIKL